MRRATWTGTRSIFSSQASSSPFKEQGQNLEDLRSGYIPDFANSSAGPLDRRLEQCTFEGSVAIVRSVWEEELRSSRLRAKLK
jgi:hypothetical protein